jgi:hypothetical protein
VAEPYSLVLRLADPFTNVYDPGVPEESFEFTEATYAKLAANGVSVRSALAVLYGTRRIRRHIGSALHIAGQDQDHVWIVLSLIECDDDQYRVTNGRYLDDEEIAAVQEMRGQG